MREWDPIGVRDAPSAQDEDDGYLGPLGSMLRRGAGGKAVAEYLAHCQEGMGLPAPAEGLSDVGDQIVSWYESSIHEGPVGT